jgi:hypothetical protein
VVEPHAGAARREHASRFPSTCAPRLILRVTTSDVDKLRLFAIDPHVAVFTGGADGTKLELPVASGPDTAPVADAAAAP